jgi:glucose-6-phosphate-specific signal transduction histidine kinase
MIFTLGLVLLGINKQLDLQTWFTLFGKHLAQEQGWYEQRRTYQAAFIGGVAVAAIATLAGLRWLVGKGTIPVRVALLGGVFLASFVLIRASSFHHVDQMLGMDFEGIKVNWILELGSISCIALAALLELRSRPGSFAQPATPSLRTVSAERPRQTSEPSRH